LAGTRFEIVWGAEGDYKHPHDHEHTHPHRGLTEIRGLVQAAALPGPVAERALAVFEVIAEAESRAHDLPKDQVHFHEVGAVDTLVDVCGTLLGFHELGIERVYSSAVTVGSGQVRCQHGVLPVPAPGTLGALLGLPILSGGSRGECATPTGAALLKVLVHQFEPPALRWTPEAFGLGAGSRDDPEVPNLLRITVGQEPAPEPGRERLVEVQCQLDDATGQVLGHAMERLLAAGALDVFFTPVQMKKNRPGTLVTVLAEAQHLPMIERLLFEETGTLGVRHALVERRRLPRRQETRDTCFGQVQFKVRELLDGSLEAVPEYEEVRRIAAEQGLPLTVVMGRLRH
jgi:uncharacterized protein (TIGR00299 family) protein